MSLLKIGIPVRVFVVAAGFAMACGNVSNDQAQRTEPGVQPVTSANLAELGPFAEVQRERTLVDFGTDEARFQLMYGWGHNERRKDRSFVWAIGERAEMEVFISRPKDLRIRIKAWAKPVKGAPFQLSTVSVNGTKVGQIKVTPWPGIDKTLETTTEHWRPGKNRLAFHFASPSRPAGPVRSLEAARTLYVAVDEIEFEGLMDSEAPSVQELNGKPVLVVPFHSEVSYYLQPGPGSRLTIDTVALVGGTGEDRAGRFRTMLTDSQGVETQLAEIDPAAAVNSLVVPLPEAAGAEVRLTFQALSEPGTDASAIALAGPILAWEPIPEPPRESRRRSPVTKPRNVIIYLIDALRADHLGCYGYSRPTSPNIDAFADDAVLFERAYAQASWTRPAVASIFTGLYPQVHGTNTIQDSLDRDLPSLPEMLDGHGLLTAAVSTNSIAGPKWGFSRGFRHFEYMKERLKTLEVHRLSDAVNQVVERWLDEDLLREPFFLFLHSTDPHGPYTPRPEFRQAFASDVQDLRVGHWDRVKALNKMLPDQVNESLINDLLALYDGEIAFNDASFGQLIERLKAEDLYDSSLIIVLSDHGEEFYDHDRWQHGLSLYQELLHIPLIIKLPEQEMAGTRTNRVVEQVDLLPTILDYLGIQIPESIQGESLVTVLQDPSTELGSDTAHAYLARSEPRHLQAFFDGERKLVWNQNIDRPRSAVELFDLANDPHELRNLAWEQPMRAGFLFSLLKSLTIEWSRQGLDQVELDQNSMDQLRELGYID